MIQGQDRNSPTGTNNSSSSHATRSGSNSINGPTSGVGSPSGSSVSVNGLERCPIGSTVKCVMLQPSSTSHNGLNGPASSQQTTSRQRKAFEGEVLAFDPRTKVLVLKCASRCGRANFTDVHIINATRIYDYQLLSINSKIEEELKDLNGIRLENRLREQKEKASYGLQDWRFSSRTKAFSGH